MNIQKTMWFDELRLVFLNILNKPSLYGNSIRLEGIILGELSLLGLLKGLEVIDVINYWKEYCNTLFKGGKYILSEIPTRYVIPKIDKNNHDLIIAQQQTYAWLSMKYVDYKVASLKQACSLSQKNVINHLNDNNIAFLENEIIKMINFEYFDELRAIPLLYGHFCSSTLGWLYYFRQVEFHPRFDPDSIYKTFSQSHHAIPEFYNDYGTADPRNKEYEKNVFAFYKNNGSLNNYTPPFYWPTCFIDNKVYKIIEKQILTCFVALANRIEPDLDIGLT